MFPRFDVGMLGLGAGAKDRLIDKRQAKVAWKSEKPGIGLRREALLGVKAEKLQRREDRRDDLRADRAAGFESFGPIVIGRIEDFVG